jgi:hypothetical protein
MPPNRPPPVACRAKQLGNDFRLRRCPRLESPRLFHLGRTLALTNRMTLVLPRNKRLSYCSEYWAFMVWKPTRATAATHSPLAIIPSMCHYVFIGVRYGCGHTVPVRIGRLVVPCEDAGCRTSLNHPQPCSTCMENCYTVIDVASTQVLTHTTRECNPCRVRRAQREGRTPMYRRARSRRTDAD